MGPGVNEARSGAGINAAAVDTGIEQRAQLALHARPWFIIEGDTGLVRVRGGHGQVEMGESHMVVATKHEMVIR